jgi:hypothetical protein
MRTDSYRLWIPAALLVLAMTLPGLVHGQMNSWTNATGGKWETGANWSLGVPPDSTQSAVIITNAGTKAVTIDAVTSASYPATMTITGLAVFAPGPDVNTLRVLDAGTATPLRLWNSCTFGTNTALVVSNSILRLEGLLGTGFTVDGSVSNLSGGLIVVTNNLTIGSVANSLGRVTTRGGFLDVSNNVIVGAAAGSQATLTVAAGTNRIYRILNIGAGGSGTVWVTGGELRSVRAFGSATQIGNLTDGRLTISNGVLWQAGVQLGANGGNATLTIAGGMTDLSGDLLLQGPSIGSSIFTMTDGTLVMTNSTLTLDTLGTAQATISAGTASIASILLGRRGTLTIAGGTVDAVNSLNVGAIPGGTGTVWITGGQVALTNKFLAAEPFSVIGRLGHGRVTISNATVAAHTLVLGQFAGSRGTLTVASGTLSATNLVIGLADCTATGIVEVAGGNLFVTNAAGTAVLDVCSGTVTVSGGLMQLDRLVVTNACGRFLHTGGTLSITTTNLDPDLSAVGDGIPNGWKQQYGLDPFDPNVANEDPDGDGFSNLEEFQVGTDPTNGGSFFRITAITRESSNVRVTWATGLGKTNALERTAGVAGGSFSTNNFAAVFTVTNTVGMTTNYLDLGAATNVPSLYYRVRLIP